MDTVRYRAGPFYRGRDFSILGSSHGTFQELPKYEYSYGTFVDFIGQIGNVLYTQTPKREINTKVRYGQAVVVLVLYTV